MQPRSGANLDQIAGVARWFEEGLSYVPCVARRYVGPGLDLDELTAAGNLGLVEAALRFDVGRGVKFATYAHWWILKGVRERVMQAAPVRLPSPLYEKLRRIRQGRTLWISCHGSEPTPAQLARATGLSREEMDELALARMVPASLDHGGERPLRDGLRTRSEDPRERLIRRDLEARLLRLVHALPERQGRVIILRFGLHDELPLSLRAVARRIGLSSERVRQIERRALAELRQALQLQHDGGEAACPAVAQGARMCARDGTRPRAREPQCDLRCPG